MMQPISQTLVESVRAPIEQVFALLTDPGRIAQWLPGCDKVEAAGPLTVGARFKAHFGLRLTEFEVVDYVPPHTIGWLERGERKGWQTTWQLEAAGGATALTITGVWTPESEEAWMRGRMHARRRVQSQLKAIMENVRNILTP
ncbi:MAG TPA: SRPBCC family protein [Gemmatimonadales bacterium]|nr:SRPBCC family protein [Gemmatimonadales bacterium]